MCGGFTCSKNALIALNLLYVVVASILISVAVYGQATALTTLPIVGGILACGILLILISFLGLAGAVKHHQVMLFFYMVILFVLFLVQFSVACACLAVGPARQEMLAEQGWNQVDMSVKERVQEQFECCSFRGRADNGTRDYPACDAVDKLCCGPLGDAVAGAGAGAGAGAAGGAGAGGVAGACGCAPCLTRLQQSLGYVFRLCGGIGLFFSFTELFAVWLARRYRNQPDPAYKEPHAIFPKKNYLY